MLQHLRAKQLWKIDKGYGHWTKDVANRKSFQNIETRKLYDPNQYHPDRLLFVDNFTFQEKLVKHFFFTFNFLIYLTTAILLFNDASFVTNWQRDKSCYNVSLYMCIVSMKKSECL